MGKWTTFDSTIKLFEAYREKMNRERPKGYNSDLANEVLKRLKQLSFLCKKIRSYQTRTMKIMPKVFAIPGHAKYKQITKGHFRTSKSSVLDSSNTISRGRKMDSSFRPAIAPTKDFCAYEKLLFEMELFAESFYFFAWRIISICKHKKDDLLPHLNSLKAEGVRDVRNSLIQHSEGSKIFMQSFACSSERGPVFKIARPEGDPYKISDQGFWLNANEFKNNLEKLLIDALGK